MKPYTLLGPHTHNGRQMKAGEPLLLSDQLAIHLARQGTISAPDLYSGPVHKPVAAKPPPKPKSGCWSCR